MEIRCLLAGVCEIELDDGKLTIECDDDASDITITSGAPGEVTITGNDGETLIGPTSPTGVTDIRIKMKDGDDRVFVDALDIDGDLKIDGGDDSNSNTVQNSTIDGNVKIENDDTDHGTYNAIFGGSYTGQHNEVTGNTIGGDVLVENGDSSSAADGLNSAGNFNSSPSIPPSAAT